MRTLYRPIWEGVQSSLRDIFREGYPADKVIQRQLKANRKWGSHDRKLFAELLYDVVRWWRKLLWVVNVEWPADDRWSTFDLEVNARVIEAWCLIHEVKLDRAITTRGLSAPVVLERWSDKTLPRKVIQSIPNWLDQWGEEQLGARWAEILPVLNTVAPVFLRTNRLCTTPDDLIKSLQADKIECRADEADCIQLALRANVFLAKAFAKGWFEVQDRHSQKVATSLLVEPGQRVIDACAGAGGKTLHLAALMQNRGQIIALDIVKSKLEQLRERSNRAHATCIETRVIESTKVIKRLKNSADRVLLDAPCTGLGVLRRNPDSKWKLTLGEVASLQQTQSQILSQYAQMCKAQGLLVYATCSIMPSENQRQVEAFLSQNETTWRLEAQETLWPEAGGADGFYLARLRRISL